MSKFTSFVSKQEGKMSIFDVDEAQIMLIEYVVNGLDVILDLKNEMGKKYQVVYVDIGLIALPKL